VTKRTAEPATASPRPKRVRSTGPSAERGSTAVPNPAGENGFVASVKAWRERIRQKPPLNLVYRIIVTVVGFAVIILGILLLPLPGPGWLIVFLGLGILSTEYEWSRRLLHWARAKVRAWSQWMGRQSIAVRALLGLAILAVILGVIALYLWWAGVPTWIPDWVPLVHDLPQRQ